MKAYLPPLSILAVILALSLWNCHTIETAADRWITQLETAEALAVSGDWPQAQNQLSDSYQDWLGSQDYLHIAARHETVDDADAMYRRAKAFAGTEEISEFRAELEDLQDQLRLLVEMEQCNLRNIL